MWTFNQISTRLPAENHKLQLEQCCYRCALVIAVNLARSCPNCKTSCVVVLAVNPYVQWSWLWTQLCCGPSCEAICAVVLAVNPLFSVHLYLDESLVTPIETDCPSVMCQPFLALANNQALYWRNSLHLVPELMPELVLLDTDMLPTSKSRLDLAIAFHGKYCSNVGFLSCTLIDNSWIIPESTNWVMWVFPPTFNLSHGMPHTLPQMQCSAVH